MQLLIDLAAKAGYSEEQLEIMRGIATEICFPLFEFNGEYIQLFGSIPSGHPLTVFLNNLCNSILLRYAFYELNPNIRSDFDEHVAVLCYGDDNKMSVKDDCVFDHTSVANVLAKVGINYTMADKSAESIPFIHASEATFLKRGAVWNDELKQYMAPIELATISKMLHCTRAGQNSPEESAGQAIDMALLEFFYHGKDVYDVRREQLIQVADKCDVGGFVPSQFPTYEDQISRYREKYLSKAA
jgi:hypothetical protein